ncbi:MAG: biopolymer transport protein ExbD [Oceanospirillaceae bacterium]|jgi:biopolymer transport protein ExbD
MGINMRSRLSLSGQEEEASIDMTPMLDVVFIMLIFFIVSTTFTRDEGVEINSPNAASAKVQASQALVVSIDAKNQAWLAQKVMPISSLSAALKLSLAQKDITSVLIKADKEASTGDLISVLDLVKTLGIKQVAVATKNAK